MAIFGSAGLHRPKIRNSLLAPVSPKSLSLTFGAAAAASFTIRLEGQDQLSLASFSTNNTGVQLTLDSEGDSANKVAITDAAVVSGSTLALKIIGVQDLTLNESAVAFRQTNVDASDLTGALTISLDLGNSFESVDLSQVNAANFIVANDANVAFLHAGNGSNIQLGSNLNTVDFTINGASASAPGSLALDLQAELAPATPITINLLDVFCAANLTINSTGASSTGANTIETLIDSSLSTLTITGDSAVTVNSIQGLTVSDSQNITIDAHTLTGSLNLNASDIADTTMLGRSITIIGGSGNNTLTNNTISESTAFVAGPGNNVINIGGGAINDSILGLKAADNVNIGTATHEDVVVKELAAGTGQATIDAQDNLIAAAQAASGLAGSNATQQVVLFSYHGGLYAFVDATGNHIFDLSHDAIIKLVGLAATADLTGVFHST